MKKPFKDLENNSTFKVNGTDFKKIPLLRVSCCRSYNAESVSNADQKIFVKPEDEVEVND
jgi:hypothetical protein